MNKSLDKEYEERVTETKQWFNERDPEIAECDKFIRLTALFTMMMARR